MKIALFGRHPSPAEHIVFPEGIPEDKMDDYSWMKSVCVNHLRFIDKVLRKEETHLYVEGFTPALISFLKAWEVWYGDNAPMLYLMHRQPDGTYRSQKWQR
tara:strand:- start:3002 stop:3304 length:303 start_codon:yes stop_codon:yes gene_type:complete